MFAERVCTCLILPVHIVAAPCAQPCDSVCTGFLPSVHILFTVRAQYLNRVRKKRYENPFTRFIGYRIYWFNKTNIVKKRVDTIQKIYFWLNLVNSIVLESSIGAVEIEYHIGKFIIKYE
ncbi:hypothetical protein EZS27_033835 [termite gut metagenome]|uniref:Uncharacterized protein n=1 Tax=termite gut metagenome TaxID=433724 RepID=A0A5J4Q4L2_9ZZZZ